MRTPTDVIIPKRPGHEVADAIYAMYLAGRDERRPHLGGSEIGVDCARRAWYSFRWAFEQKYGDGTPEDAGRIFRLFQRGHREEAFFVADLRGLQIEVYEHDPRTGKQWHFTDLGGHFGCSLDGVLRTLRGYGEWLLLECKTHNRESFTELQIMGVREAKPQHYSQMQTYMKQSGLRRALYMAVCKDDDSLYTEIVEYDEPYAERLMARAKQVVFGAEPLEKISNDPAYFKCKLCPAYQICQGNELPLPNCRTCAHATPMPDGTWRCELHNKTLTADEQRHGCEDHAYIPAIIANRFEYLGSDDGKTTKLRDRATGAEVRNGRAGAGVLSSEELRIANVAALDENIESLRAAFGGRIVEAQPDPNLVDGAKVIEAIEGAASWARPDKDKLPKARARR